MGMYDTVLVNCPNCNEEHQLQTKSGQCNLDVYTLDNCPDDVMVNVNRHCPCRCDCGVFFKVDLETRKVILTSGRLK